MSRLLDTQEINYIVDALNYYADERDRIASEGHGGRLERDSYRADAEDCWDLAELIGNHDITLECETTK